MTAEQKAFLTVAVEAAHAAGKIQQFYASSDLEIDTKSSETDLVTKADKLCEKKIREIILAAYPDHEILGEEGGSTGESNHRWVVDPIDGTLNYAHGLPFYCVSIGLEIEGQLAIGVIFDSVKNELFTAVRGEGAFLNGAPIEVSKESELIRSMLVTGFAYQKETVHENVEIFGRVHQKVRSVRRLGAAALDLCYIACGRLEGFWELKLSPWDVAAGVLIVREAGGTVTDGRGGHYSINERKLIASNGVIHSELVGLLELSSLEN